MSGESIRAYVGLGGNVGDVEETMMEALMAIDGLPQTSIRVRHDNTQTIHECRAQLGGLHVLRRELGPG